MTAAFDRSIARALAAALSLAVLLVAACASADPRIAAEIEALTASPLLLEQQSGRDLAAFYAARDHQPVWTDWDGLSPRGEVVAHTLARAADHGLDPSAYPVKLPGGSDAASRARELATLDLLVSTSLARFAYDLGEGRIDPRTVQADLPQAPHVPGPVALLHKLAAADDLPAHIGALAPQHAQYQSLRRALEHYRSIADRGGWPELPEITKLERGTRDPRVTILRARLEASGDLMTRTTQPDLFDGGLELAVKQFQRRHGLESDGIVGAQTRTAMNVPVKQRIRQIEINLERWRWLPDDLGDRYLMVDIAGFRLGVVEQRRLRLLMRVVVGTPYHSTPVFAGTMTYLDINPYWNVPNSIARNEILPKLRENPHYLVENHYELFESWHADATPVDSTVIDWSQVDAKSWSYRIRQRPGPWNALGSIKFMFPNDYDVYLHDTPSRSLFGRTARAFSHGCIRVEKPLDLAVEVLGHGSEWTAERIEATIGGAGPTTVNLPRPLPVYLVYQTAWTGEGGLVHFHPDIYRRDARLAAVLYGSG